MNFIFYKYRWSRYSRRIIFNVKIWTHPIPMKFIYCNYTWSKITCRVINLTPSNSNKVYILLLHVEQKFVKGHFSMLKFDPIPHPNEGWGHFSKLKFEPTHSQWILYIVTTREAKLHVGSFDPTQFQWSLYIITTPRAEIHVGSFFNVKIWPLPHPNEVWGHFSTLKFDPHPIPMKFILYNYTWNHTTYRVIFQR